ncbi:MAG: glycosyltransferase [Flavobacteriales bacterium]|nr:glycosyltransferase [Flavobacteriales bacterium]
MKLVLLTNFIPPYRLSLYQGIDQIFDDFEILISTGMEKNRNWEVNHEALQVSIQKSISYSKNWKNELGFSEKTSIQLPWDTIGLLKRIDADVVISGEMGIRSFLSALYCSWYKKPLILWLTLSEHTETNKKGVRILLRKFLLKKSTTVLCNGKSGERYLQALGYQNKVFYAPYTSDYKINSKSSFHSKKKILFSGQLIQRKGISEMIDAIDLLFHNNKDLKFELVVAGSGPQEALFYALSKWEKQLTLTMLGALKYDDLKKVYQDIDLFLFPTLADEWGVVVNEALSSGVPILGSKYSQAVEELLVENQNGWIFDPLDTNEFAQKLKTAIHTESAKLLSMSRFAAESIKDITPNKIAQNIYDAALFATKTSISDKQHT